MFFLVLIREDCVTEVFLDCALSSVVFTAKVLTLVLDFIKSIKSMITVINPIRQINRATPREIAEIRADLYSVLPTSLL